MRYKITKQQYLWFCLVQTSNQIMRELRSLVKSKEEYLEIEMRLWDIIAKKRKVIGYYGKIGPKVSVDSQEKVECEVLL